MVERVRLNKIDSVITEYDFPMSRSAAERTFGDVRLDLADGTASFGETIGRSEVETFESASELRDELYSMLPRRAVGEPFQSEGDA